ncbi:MAG: 50S ribosomal protein L29 [Anaerolineales bacterium]|nr:50S ribosomal protein L29 [Anaerolineales bacterium]
MKAQEIRKLSVEEIQVKLDDSREELMKLRFQQVTGQLTDTSRLRRLRRDIARMETIARELLIAPVEVREETEEKKPKARVRSKVKEEAEPKAKAEPKPKAAPKAKAEPKTKAAPKSKAEPMAEAEEEGEA